MPSPNASILHCISFYFFFHQVILLSKRGEDFEGGVLTVSDESKWQHEVSEEYRAVTLNNPGDAVVFPSHKFHNVSTVTKGKRHVAVMELWNEASGPGVVDDRPGEKIVIQL